MPERVAPVKGRLLVSWPLRYEGENGRPVRVRVLAAPPKSGFRKDDVLLVVPYAGVPYPAGAALINYGDVLAKVTQS